jgi:hypothetical protein
MSMSWKDYFVVGIKLIGLYCLVRGIEDFVNVTPRQLRMLQEMGQVHGVLKLSALMSMTIPLIMGGLGLYLIRDGKCLLDLPKFDVGMDGDRGWLALGIVLFGVYLVASVVPYVLQIIPDLVAVLLAPAYVSKDESMQRLGSITVLASITVSLGAVCVFRGPIMAACAFKRDRSAEREVQ